MTILYHQIPILSTENYPNLVFLFVINEKSEKTKRGIGAIKQSDAYICSRYSVVHTVAETIDRPDFFIDKSMLRIYYSCSQKLNVC